MATATEPRTAMTKPTYDAMRAKGFKPIEMQAAKRAGLSVSDMHNVTELLDAYRANGATADEIVQAVMASAYQAEDGTVKLDFSKMAEGAAAYAGQPLELYLNRGEEPVATAKPTERRYMGRVAAAFIGGALALLGARDASAAPIMDIVESRSEADYWPANPGNEALFQYAVTNDTVGGASDEMTTFKLPVGSNEGVFYTTAPTDWSFAINLEDTVFTADNSAAYLLPNGGSGLFELYSTDLDIHQDLATAMSNLNGAFDPVSVDVPGQAVPEPSSLALLALGFAGLLASHNSNRKARV